MDLNKPNQCRCCLAENRKLKDMTDLLVVAKKQKDTIMCCYSACSGINLSHSQPDISKSICKPCEKKLIIAYEFRELCQESDRVLQERARLLTSVKKEDLSDEEVPQSFNQVFLEVQADVLHVIPAEVIKIEDDSPREAAPKQEEKMEFDGEAVKSPGSDNWNDNYEPGDVSSTNEYEQDDKQEEPTTDCNEIDDMNGKILCFQCELVLNSIGDYKVHRITCKGSRYKQYCTICNEAVKRYNQHLEQKHKDYKPFECGSCDAKYTTLNNLRHHLYVHTKRKTFQCMASFCYSNFHTPKELRCHITYNNKHKINHYHCHVCGSNFPKFLQLVDHCESHRNDDTVNFANLPFVPCFHCKKLFVKRRNFLAHKCESVPKVLKKWRTKKGSKATVEKYKLALSTRWTKVAFDSTPQTCDKCLKVFTNDDEFACHRYSECAEDPKFICPDCGKEFINMQALKSHADVHVENRRFICESCGIAFAVKVSLAKHMLTHTIGRTFKCSLCPASFVDNNGLKIHSSIHTERKFECDFCGHRFRTYEQIKQHMPVHSIELRKFGCEICNKRFARRSELRKHIRHFHSGMKPLNCAFCKRVFRDPAVLKRHHRDRHSQITYECPHCQKRMVTRTGFTEHLFLHRGFSPYNCPECPRKFIKQVMFSKHLMKGHSIKYDEKTHGYQEMELNMREVLSEAERHPNNMPINMDMDMDVKNTSETAEFFAESTVFACGSDDTMSWKTKNNPFSGCPQ